MSKCNLSKGEFSSKATPILVDVGKQQVLAAVKEFSTGSFGWYGTGKVFIDVGGTPVQVQVSLSLIVVGSKDAK